MGDSGEGWQTVMPTSHAGIDRLSRPQLEAYERQVLKEWEASRGHWSGIGKHTSGTDFAEAKKLHPRFKPAAADSVLGSGAYGVVERVTYAHNNHSVCLARKHIKYKRGRTIQLLREEARVMELLDHEHIVRLVGTYSIRTNELFLLIWPVATCNLTSLLDDIDALRTGQGDRDDIVKRLEALELKDLIAVERRRGAAAAAAAAAAAQAQAQRQAQQQAAGGVTAGKSGCPLRYLQQIMGCISQAVAYCHGANIRHLDLKPSNILLNPGGVYLADFGIARDVNGRDHTLTFGLQGTPKWRAPEICDPSDEWSMKAADIYSLGLVHLNIASALYGAPLGDFDDILEDLSPHGRAEKLRAYHARLELLALATQQVADHRAHTFAPKHVVGLTSRMLSPRPSTRPRAEQVELELVELGGIEQAYHSPCCRKSSRFVTRLLDQRYASAVEEGKRLRAENERMARRLVELEGRDETYQMRLENERMQYARARDILQKQLEEEQKGRKRLEALVAEMQQGGGPGGSGRRPQPLPGIPRPERSISGEANSVLKMRTRPNATTNTTTPPSAPTYASVSSPLQPQQQPAAAASATNAAAVTTPQRPQNVSRPSSSIPLPTPSPTPSPGFGPDINATATSIISNYALRSRGSGSRLPVAVRPDTPKMTRDPSLTDSTQASMASSVFSRLSRESESTTTVGTRTGPGTPSLNENTAFPGASLKAENPSRNEAGVGLGVSFVGDVDAHAAPAVRRESVASSIGKDASSVAGSVAPTASIPGTASPVLTGSALSSPRAVKAEVNVEAATASAPRKPQLPTAKSWADVARREKK